MQNYAYPIDSDWSTDETVKVVEFLTAVEQVYESSMDVKEFSIKYQKFKEVVTSISGEKKLDKVFQSESGYSIYQAVKLMKELNKTETKNKKMRIN